jgi:hypothetical protein
MIVLLHFLKPELDPITRNLSEYANGRYGFLMTLFFLFMSVGYVGMAFHSYSTLTQRPLRALCSFLFLVCAISSLMLGIFPMNLEHTPSTASSMIHHQAGPIFLIAAVVAITVFTIRIRFERPYKPHFIPLVIYGAITFCIGIVVIFFIHKPEYTGLLQRLVGLSMWMWLMNASFRLT